MLAFDNTIIARTGKKHRMARKLKDPVTGWYATGYDLVSAHFSEFAGTINLKEYRRYKKCTNLWYVSRPLYLNGRYMARMVFVKNIEPGEGEDSEIFWLATGLVCAEAK